VQKVGKQRTSGGKRPSGRNERKPAGVREGDQKVGGQTGGSMQRQKGNPDVMKRKAGGKKGWGKKGKKTSKKKMGGL